jgi:putative transposase
MYSRPPISYTAGTPSAPAGRFFRLMQAEFPELRKQYWGQHMWARGYFCATVGAVDEATIKAYIENQRWDEDDESFKITAPTKP